MIGGVVYDTVADAFAAAVSGDVILIGPGIYPCADLDIPDGVQVIGSGMYATELNGATSTTYVIGFAASTTASLSDLKVNNPRTTGDIFGVRGYFSGSAGAILGRLKNILIECKEGLSGSHNRQGFTAVNGTYILTNVHIDVTSLIPTGTAYALAGFNASGGTCRIEMDGGRLRSGWGEDVYGLNSSVTIDLIQPYLVNNTFGGSPTLHGTYQTSVSGSERFVSLDDLFQGAGEDIYPNGAGHPLSARFIESGRSPTDHFQSGVIPTGYTWQVSSPFVVPSNLLYSHKGDWLRFTPGSSVRSFLSRTGAVRGTRYFARISISTASNCGRRVDDGTDNNYMDWRVAAVGASYDLWLVQRTGGGTATVTNFTTYSSDKSVVICLFDQDLGSGNHRAQCYLITELGEFILIATGATVPWTPSRSGLIGFGVGLNFFDWFEN
jgi:hypothetical protein